MFIIRCLFSNRSIDQWNSVSSKSPSNNKNHPNKSTALTIRKCEMTPEKVESIVKTPERRKANALKQYSKLPLSNLYAPNKLKYIVVSGNNSGLIREAMQKRQQWIEIPNINSIFNFKWQPVSTGIRFDELQAKRSVKQVVNHLKGHKWISEKNHLFHTLKRYCEQKHENVFDYGMA